MDPEQNDSAALQGDRAPKSELPKVSVKRQEKASFRFGSFDECAVFDSWAIGPGPNNVVAVSTQSLDNRSRKILVRKKPHSGGDRVGLVLVRKIASVG